MRSILPPGLAAMAIFAGDAALAEEASPNSVDELVVTAERTGRSLRDTASSVAIITAADADRAGLQSTNDALDLIPNISALRSGGIAPVVRGIDGGGPAVGANAFFAGTRPRLSYQVDGRTLTYNEALYIDGGIWDSQQIEVLRGPQSTLQGRNSVGGIVAIKTADPTFTLSGQGRVLVGDDDLLQVSGAVGGPLVADVLAFRLAADFRKEEAYVQMNSYTELEHPERIRSEVVRGKLLFTPNAAFRSLNSVSYTDAYAPQVQSTRQPFTDYVTSVTRDPRFRTRALVGISDNTWTVNEQITLSAFLTASDFHISRYANAGNGNADIHGEEYTAEPRIRFGQADDQVSGFLAVFLFDAKQHETIDLFGGGTFRDATSTSAVFGEALWKPTDRLNVTLGARYEREERDRVGRAGVFTIDFHKTFEVFLPRITVKYDATEAVAIGATIGRGYNAGGAGFAFNPPFPSFTYDKETVWNYEAFVRSTLLDGRLTLNGNVFYNDYSGLQLPFTVAVTAQGPSTIIRNSEKATTYGAEVEARWRALDWLDAVGAVGLLETEIDEFGDPAIQGNDLVRAPAFSASAGLFVKPVNGFDGSLTFRWTDTYYSEIFNAARGRTKAHGILNLQAGYRFGAVRVFGQVYNLLDEQTPQSKTPAVNPASDTAIMTRPRRLTVGIEASF